MAIRSGEMPRAGEERDCRRITEVTSFTQSLAQDPVSSRSPVRDHPKPLSTRQLRISQASASRSIFPSIGSTSSGPVSCGQPNTAIRSEGMLKAGEERKRSRTTEVTSFTRSQAQNPEVVGSQEWEEVDETCTQCLRRFSSTDLQSTIDRHLDSHIRARRSFACREQDCGLEFFLYENLRRHSIEDHGQVLCTERTCDVMFSSVQDLDVHLQSPQHYPCRHQPCPCIYTHSGGRNQHERLIHGAVWEDSFPDDIYE
ncbi:MAG: hypothetical protein JOS17DRAFT_801186, partial [Linnemannia elongata]